ncbi:MAG: hypothetical protein PHW46_01170 [Candidatus Omnitrophica bacterium]|nr:hypothetical protein [Candidatus Omnitrophota bacterium]
MLIEKEIDIIHALIEEEIIRTQNIKDENVAGIVERYCFTLANIESKLQGLQSVQRTKCRVY